jgi:glycosyltransferase involved in cell wall biosynthesis
VDDGSPSAIAIRVFEEQQRRYPQFTFISQANGGPGKARNLALSLARGEYFITVDADNIPRPDMVERFVEGFARHGNCSVLTCYVAAFRGIESLKREEFEFLYIPTGGPHVAACFTNVYGDTNAMFRAADLRAVGGFETDHRTPFEDWETFIKIANAGHSIDVIPEPLFFYRLRGDNRSFTMTKSYTETYPFMRRIVKSLCATPGSTDSELESVWHYVAGIEAQARRRHQLELQVGELRAQLDMLLSVQERVSAQHAIIEELSRHRLRLRYRAADKCVNALRRVPIVHGICRRALPVFWRGWKAIKGKGGD